MSKKKFLPPKTTNTNKINKLNIAIFHLAFIYSGGGEKLVLQQYDGLKKIGHKVSLYATALDIKKSFPEIINKYKIKRFLPWTAFLKGHEAFQTVLTCILAPFVAHRFRKFDVILACNQPSVWIAYVVNKIYGVPYVSYLAQPTRFLHPRNIDKVTGLFFSKGEAESVSARLMMTTFRKFSDWADRVSIKRSFRILVNGEYMRKKLASVYGINAISCPSGVLKTNFLPRSKRDRYILVSNRHFAQKRLEYAIFTLSYLLPKNPDIRLVITGSNTEYTRKLIGLAKELAIDRNIFFTGYIKEKELGYLYDRALLYLYTAPEEDFGMGIIEALSRGVPVVAWDSAGPSKIIQNGVSGLLAKPFNLLDFYQKTERILSDTSLWNRLAKNSLKRVSSGFTFESHIGTVNNSLSDAAGQRKKRWLQLLIPAHLR